ncbi:MAG: type II toxin-antitoxin system RelE/ParE family toxin [Asticcacaulis sp.]|nr:type II toxin-antitoxin system RelE/ParE family toxin [Asticcacaulis sp.]
MQDYIARDSPAAAHRLTMDIFNRVEALLSADPLAGRQGRIADTRELVVPHTAYIVAYRVLQRVEILAVVHAARRWPESFS